jgi:hypothetical protein
MRRADQMLSSVLCSEKQRSVLRTGRIFDTPPLKGYTFVDFRLRSSTPVISATSVCACIRPSQAGPLLLERK